MKTLFSLLLFMLLFTSCIDNNTIEQPDYHYEFLPIAEYTIPDSFDWNETYDITIKYILPNGCYQFHSLYYETEETNRIIAVYAIVEDDIACTEALITKEYTFQVRATQEEEYTFKIWKGLDDNDDDIFEEVVVPVTAVPEPTN